MTKLSKAQREKYDHVIGSRRQVWNGSAHHTSGGLTRPQLFMTKNGRIVSKSKHFSAKKDRRLIKAGYGTKKGKFGFVLLNGKKGKRGKTMKKRGGYSGHLPLSPTEYNGAGEGTSGVALQLEAGQAGGRRTRRRRRGGYTNYALSPANYDGMGEGTSGVALQFEAGQAGGKRRKSRRRRRGGQAGKVN